MGDKQQSGATWIGIILIANGAYFAAYGSPSIGYFMILLGVLITASMKMNRPNGPRHP